MLVEDLNRLTAKVLECVAMMESINQAMFLLVEENKRLRNIIKDYANEKNYSVAGLQENVYYDDLKFSVVREDFLFEDYPWKYAQKELEND